jgi:hypothetical protein
MAKARPNGARGVKGGTPASASAEWIMKRSGKKVLFLLFQGWMSGAEPGGLPLFLNDLPENERPRSVEPPAAAVAHLVRAEQDHLHGPGAFGQVDEEVFEGGGREGAQGGTEQNQEGTQKLRC